jgi:hypothetical protein
MDLVAGAKLSLKTLIFRFLDHGGIFLI